MELEHRHLRIALPDQRTGSKNQGRLEGIRQSQPLGFPDQPEYLNAKQG
jgi:hypothetical protein